MKKFLMILVSVLLLPAQVFAQQQNELVTMNKEVTCTSTEIIMKFITNSKFQETPLWVGSDQHSYWSIVSNPETGTWTLIQFTDKVGCIIGVGKWYGNVGPQPK